MNCPKCTSSNIQTEGNRYLYSKTVNFDFFICDDCGTRFAENPKVSDPEEKRQLPTREELLKNIRARHDAEEAQQSKIDELLNGTSLYPPPIFKSFCDSIQNPESTLEDLLNIMAGKQDAVERLLCFANSSIFKPSNKSESLRDLFLAYEKDIESIIYLQLALEAVSTIEHPKALPLSRTSFWMHGITSGLSAKLVSEFLGESKPERYFAIGLLLHIGRLALAQSLPETAWKIFEQNKSNQQALYKIEEALLDFNHAQIGGNLLRKWGVSENLIQGVILHLRPHKSKRYYLEADIFHISEVIAHDLKLGDSGEQFFPKPNAETIQTLGLTRSTLDNIKNEVIRLAEETSLLTLGKSPAPPA